MNCCHQASNSLVATPSATITDTALDDCADRHLIRGTDQLRMHQLLVVYLHSIAATSLTTDETDAINTAECH